MCVSVFVEILYKSKTIKFRKQLLGGGDGDWMFFFRLVYTIVDSVWL